MDILLANAPVKREFGHASLAPPLGLAYIAAVLIRDGYDVSAMDLNIGSFDILSVKRALETERPAILGISAHTETYLGGLKLARIAKEINPEIIVVMGGTHPTAMYQDVANEEDVDIVVIGEGEDTMLELANCIIRSKVCLSEIKGIAYREGEVVRITKDRPFIVNLDGIPFPAREIFPIHLYRDPGQVLMSRGGCPFNCHFCAVNNIWKGSRKFRNPENVINEILHIFDNFHLDEIGFDDDAFTLNREHVISLCDQSRKLRELFPWHWTCTTRVDLVDRRLLNEMREAGCYHIQYGIEAGSQKILDSIGKKITLDQVREAVDMTLDFGIETTCFFMFPHPDDTEQTIREQKHFMKELINMGALETLSMTTPYPGTYYYAHADELGIKILARNWDEYDAKNLTITTRHLSEERLRFLLAELVQDVGLTNDVQVS